jgi:hypothetical protein
MQSIEIERSSRDVSLEAQDVNRLVSALSVLKSRLCTHNYRVLDRRRYNCGKRHNVFVVSEQPCRLKVPQGLGLRSSRSNTMH